jgi:hypothetical protein
MLESYGACSKTFTTSALKPMQAYLKTRKPELLAVFVAVFDMPGWQAMLMPDLARLAQSGT